MFSFISKLTVTALAASLLVTGTPPKPAAAQSQGTINTLIGAAAVIGGIVLYNNYVHQQQAANQIVGYTRNGGTIYGDGRIVMPNGQYYRPNSYGQYPGGQYVYYSPRAVTTNYVYDYQRTGRWDATHRHGNYYRNTTVINTNHPGNNGIGHAYGHNNDHYNNGNNNGHAYGHDANYNGHGNGHGDGRDRNESDHH